MVHFGTKAKIGKLTSFFTSFLMSDIENLKTIEPFKHNTLIIKFININKLMFTIQTFFVTRRIAYAILIQFTLIIMNHNIVKCSVS